MAVPSSKSASLRKYNMCHSARFIARAVARLLMRLQDPAVATTVGNITGCDPDMLQIIGVTVALILLCAARIHSRTPTD